MKTRIEEAAKGFCMSVPQGRESMGAYIGFIAGAEFMQKENEKLKAQLEKAEGVIRSALHIRNQEEAGITEDLAHEYFESK